ncbi:isoleucine--tRNA ligase [Helicobacter sp. MIT 99-5507]|uniref:isoleucine--tRNA ligase n=1 Tax=Helicobacter sp. MIT 99-5507 TaxID=152489 RepID=UPI000E1E8275|nr:isoleucine--tRNA ligase [Helicobacter sp. MIT 99-5507]RDU56528.1 isoleucine--tRNA ligase [Helicobacter sp. MIT 99-5507]
MDYKDTLNLAISDFPMRGNLPQNEPVLYKQWKENDAFLKMKLNNKNATSSFTLHDGPPYANGSLHVGHALNKILKDIIVKYNYFRGKKIYYTPGWDCHGLPIEQQIEQKIGTAKKTQISNFRELCRNHAKEFIKLQSDGFESFGVLGDFNNPYVTMDFAFEAKIFDSLCNIAKSRILAQRYKPIYWSWACQTALAEAEVEYKDKVSDSIFVRFNLSDATKAKLPHLGDNASVIIWTTTPWTLPANVAIALNPNIEYIITTKGFIVAKKLHQKLCLDMDIGEIKAIINQNELENLSAINPLNNRESKIILGEHVSDSDGSGAVHTAPGHGEDDYNVGLKYNLEVLVPVDDFGNYDDSVVNLALFPKDVANEFVGVNVFKAQDRILELLGDSLLKHTKITHSYPHCWRSHKPVIYRATTQWFILMDKPFFDGLTLREIALKEIEKVNFYPKSGYKRLQSMIQNRPDWCISRQRAWGVPIAFFHYKDTKEPIFDDELFSHLSNIFKEEGLDCWWSKDIKDLLPSSWQSKASELYKGEHILDVWFDSGSTWNAVLNSPKYDAGEYPADLYLEGSDQHRGWFQSSLLVSCAINHKAPFKNILTHGFTVDENGEKMSKSKGNVIAPESILKEYGSEILRLWVALSDYQSDLKISQNILKQISEQYRKIRNTIRFLLANTNDFKEFVGTNELGSIDRWLLKRAIEVFDEANRLFSEYEFSKSLNLVMNFITNELSGIYFDLCKDSLYCDKATSTSRRAIQTTLCLVARKLFLFLAPILTYSIDEALKYASNALKGDLSDVFSCRDSNIDYDLEVNENFDELLELRSLFGAELDRLKKEKLVKSSLELEISFDYPNASVLSSWLIVSGVNNNFEKSNILSTISLNNGKVATILKSSRYKCPRCWKFNSNSQDCLCDRCNSSI